MGKVMQEARLEPVFYDPPEWLPEGSDPRRAAMAPVSMLLVDQNTQRDTYESRLDEMAQSAQAAGSETPVDWALVEAITVTIRESGEWVVTEGQNRVLLIRREIPDAWVHVVISPSSNEAAVALRIAESRKAHSPLQKWNLRLKDNGLLERLAEVVIGDNGLNLSNDSHRWDGISAVGAVIRIMKTYGGRNPSDEDLADGAELLDTVLKIITTVWGVKSKETTPRFDGKLLIVLARLISRNERIDLERLSRVLAGMNPGNWLLKGKERHPAQSSTEAIAQAILAVYNRGKAEANQIRW